jgi:hypothetical protein
MVGNDGHQRRIRRRPDISTTSATVEAWARQRHIPKQRVVDDRMATLDDRPATAVVATPSPFDPCCRLSLDNPALGGGEQLLAFGEGETDIFRDRGCLIPGGDFLDTAGLAAVSRYLKQDSHLHGFSPNGRRNRSRIAAGAEDGGNGYHC